MLLSLNQLIKIFNFLYLNGIVFYFSWLICQFLIKTKTRIDYIINLAGIFFMTINLIIIIFGLFGLISSLELTVIFTIVLGILLYRHKKLANQKITFPSLNIEKYDFSKISFFVFLFSITCFSFFVLLFYLNSFRYGQIFFDASYFYLPTVIHWLQSGILKEWPEVNVYVRYIPAGYYIYFYWIISIFHNDFLVGIISPTFLLLYLITAYGLGRKLKFPLFWLLLCLFSFCSMPVFGNVLMMHNDVGVVYSFTLSLYYAFFYFKENRNIYLILCGAATGICLGMKYTGLLWMVTICNLIIICIYNVTSNIKKSFLLLMEWCGIVLLFGGYWYIRNFIKTGNFLFPLMTKIFNIPLYLPNYDYTLISERLNKDLSKCLLHNFSILWKSVTEYVSLWGFDYFLIFLSTFITIGYLIFILIKINKNILKKESLKIIFCSISMLSILFLLIVPNSGVDTISLRYGFPAIIFSILTLGFFTKNKWFRIFLETIFVLNIIFGLKVHTKYYLFIIAISLLICLAFAIYMRLFNFKKHLAFVLNFSKTILKKKLFISVIILFTTITLLFLENFVSKKRFSDYGYQIIDFKINESFQWIEKNIHNACIGYFDESFTYPLCNTDFSNQIKSLSATNAREFIEETKTKSIDYVFFRKNLLYGKMDIRYKFTENNPQIFNVVFRNENVIIYKVKKQQKIKEPLKN